MSSRYKYNHFKWKYQKLFFFIRVLKCTSYFLQNYQMQGKTVCCEWKIKICLSINLRKRINKTFIVLRKRKQKCFLYNVRFQMKRKFSNHSKCFPASKMKRAPNRKRPRSSSITPDSHRKIVDQDSFLGSDQSI